MFLDKVTNRMKCARGPFLDFAPSPSMLVRGRKIKRILKIVSAAKQTYMLASHKDNLGTITGKIIGSKMVKSPIKRYNRHLLVKGHAIAQFRNRPIFNHYNGVGGKNWINHDVDSGIDGRTVKRMRIVYHQANKAGSHLDVHIGHLSIVARISGKPVEKDIKFHNGKLTDSSKKALLNHLRSEIANNSRFAQNLDHSITNSAISWNYNEDLSKVKSYGAGPTRQIIAEDNVEFYHLQNKGLKSLHMYAPMLEKHQGLYMYPIYDGKDTGTPILIWGKLHPRPDTFNDRLHLKLIQPEELDKFINKSDIATCTRKYDGASTYFNSNGQGFKFWSPRFSKKTGERIEYTFKVPELASKGSNYKPTGMGEMLFWKRTQVGEFLRIFGIRGPENIAWNYLDASNIGGILNSDKVRDRNILPELRIYRIDKFEGKNTYDYPFWSNRELQKKLVVNLDTRFWKIVSLAIPKIRRNQEGLVSVPEGMSVNNALKIKWHGDLNDWKINKVLFYLSDKQNITGVIECTSLESGKNFNLGPGQVGSVDRCMSMIENPSSWEGRVLKVSGFNGHEGRAAKVRDIHLDK